MVLVTLYYRLAQHHCLFKIQLQTETRPPVKTTHNLAAVLKCQSVSLLCNEINANNHEVILISLLSFFFFQTKHLSYYKIETIKTDLKLNELPSQTISVSCAYSKTQQRLFNEGTVYISATELRAFTTHCTYFFIVHCRLIIFNGNVQLFNNEMGV